MTSPVHDHSTADHTTTAATARPSMVTRVEAALMRLDLATCDVGSPPATDLGHVGYCLALARISARRAGGWRLLLTAQRYDPTLPPVAERAASIAWRHARDDYRFWRESAADWAARAEHRPTSDAAGALSNWDELGVSA